MDSVGDLSQGIIAYSHLAQRYVACGELADTKQWRHGYLCDSRKGEQALPKTKEQTNAELRQRNQTNTKLANGDDPFGNA
jgi:hypothetical protein